jgi:hypothetical protein
MKIETETLKVLKSFTDIHPGLTVKSGWSIMTINPEQNLIGVYLTQEKFPVDFSLYDLGSFLGTMGLFSEPAVEFKEHNLLIKEKGSSCQYGYCDPAILNLPKGGIVIPEMGDNLINFQVTHAVRSKLLKAASLINSDTVSIDAYAGQMSLCVSRDDHDNEFKIEINDVHPEQDFSVSLNINYMKFFQGDYNVSLSITDNLAFAQWQHKTLELSYFVAMAVNEV